MRLLTEVPAGVELVQRVEKLERQNRVLRIVLLSALALVAAILLMGEAANRPKVIEAESFVVKDANGAKRIELKASEAGANISFFDPKGDERMWLKQDAKGSIIAVRESDEAGLQMSQLGGEPMFALNYGGKLVWLKEGNVEMSGGGDATTIAPGLVSVVDADGYTAELGKTFTVNPRTGVKSASTAATVSFFSKDKTLAKQIH